MIFVNVRIIAVINVNIEKVMVEGMFWEDLYYWINCYLILILLFWQCKEDIEVLSIWFIEKIN